MKLRFKYLKSYIHVGTLLLGMYYRVYAQEHICQGSTHLYSVDSSENGGEGSSGSSYNWWVEESNFEGEISAVTNSSNKVNIDWGETAVGSYTIWVRETDANGCFNEVQLEIIIDTPIYFTLPTIYLCPDSYDLILVQGPPNMDSYNWMNEESQTIGTMQDININLPGTYTLQVTKNECSFSADLEVILVDLPVIQYSVENNSMVVVTPIGGLGPYRYQLLDDNQNVIRPWQDSPVFNQVEEGNYLIQVESINGNCLTSAQIRIFSIPNVITPNGDGINDVWNLTGLIAYEVERVRIYDRYGKEIEVLTPETGMVWEGLYLGRPLPSTSYWYAVEFSDGKVIKGYIMIKNRNSDN